MTTLLADPETTTGTDPETTNPKVIIDADQETPVIADQENIDEVDLKPAESRLVIYKSLCFISYFFVSF